MCGFRLSGFENEVKRNHFNRYVLKESSFMPSCRSESHKKWSGEIIIQRFGRRWEASDERKNGRTKKTAFVVGTSLRLYRDK
mmetsp:Transcript_40393/g.56865  ORF Transcript_40393/g.56865 Transcript_40393/m.56865 type:complete len:82 (+) Transcript_40393:123-368(+)